MIESTNLDTMIKLTLGDIKMMKDALTKSMLHFLNTGYQTIGTGSRTTTEPPQLTNDLSRQAMIENVTDNVQMPPDLQQLKLAVEWLQKSLDEAFLEFSESSKRNPLETLAEQAELVRYFMEIWVIYREAWEQALSISGSFPQQAGIPEDEAKSVRAANRAVQALYDLKGLPLKQEQKQAIRVVPFYNRLYATASESPVPLIVTPYWGHQQVWTWIGYVHEVGHHIFRNVLGLQDELKVRVIMALWSNNISYEIQGICFDWLEELFADVYGLLQIGPAFSRTQQHMLLYLPASFTRRFKNQNKDLRLALLEAADVTHPVPYVRAWATLESLKALDQGDIKEDIIKLKQQWENIFEGLSIESVTVLVNPSSGSAWPNGEKPEKVEKQLQRERKSIQCSEIENAMKIVIKVLLDARLYALAKKGTWEPRSLSDVFLGIDMESVGLARQALDQTDSEAGPVPSEGFEVRHLLAAAQEKWTEVSNATAANEVNNAAAAADIDSQTTPPGNTEPIKEISQKLIRVLDTLTGSS